MFTNWLMFQIFSLSQMITITENIIIKKKTKNVMLICLFVCLFVCWEGGGGEFVK